MRIDPHEVANIKLAQMQIENAKLNLTNAGLANDLLLAQLSAKVGADLKGANIAADGTVTLAPREAPVMLPPPMATDDEP